MSWISINRLVIPYAGLNFFNFFSHPFKRLPRFEHFKSRRSLFDTLLTEKELIAGHRKPRIQRLIYERYFAAMSRLCLRYLQNETDTFEAMTAGFLLVFKKLSGFEYRGTGSLEAWMRQIMINECLARLRKKRASSFALVPLEQVTEVSEEAFNEIDAGYLYEAIRMLPDGARAVFNMNVMEGYAHKEIGQKLGITESASRSQLTYAKKKLKEYLEPYMDE